MVIRNGFALSRLKIYKLQSDYADKIHKLNLSAVTTLVTAHFSASFWKKRGGHLFQCCSERTVEEKDWTARA